MTFMISQVGYKNSLSTLKCINKIFKKLRWVTSSLLHLRVHVLILLSLKLIFLYL